MIDLDEELEKAVWGVWGGDQASRAAGRLASVVTASAAIADFAEETAGGSWLRLWPDAGRGGRLSRDQEATYQERVFLGWRCRISDQSPRPPANQTGAEPFAASFLVSELLVLA